jgi:hypothetical protein
LVACIFFTTKADEEFGRINWIKKVNKNHAKPPNSSSAFVVKKAYEELKRKNVFKKVLQNSNEFSLPCGTIA